jgi:hypothetical protein
MTSEEKTQRNMKHEPGITRLFAMSSSDFWLCIGQYINKKERKFIH